LTPPPISPLSVRVCGPYPYDPSSPLPTLQPLTAFFFELSFSISYVFRPFPKAILDFPPHKHPPSPFSLYTHPRFFFTSPTTHPFLSQPARRYSWFFSSVVFRKLEQMGLFSLGAILFFSPYTPGFPIVFSYRHFCSRTTFPPLLPFFLIRPATGSFYTPYSPRSDTGHLIMYGPFNLLSSFPPTLRRHLFVFFPPHHCETTAAFSSLTSRLLSYFFTSHPLFFFLETDIVARLSSSWKLPPLGL